MPDEIALNPEPTNASIPQAPETLNSTLSEAVIEPVPVEQVSPPEPIPEPSSGHLGGNDPIEPASTESILSSPAVETHTDTPVAIPEPAPVLTPTEATPVVQVETSPPTTHEPIVPDQVSEPTPTPTPTPAQVVATVVAPIVATTIAQAFTKSMSELFTKALNARQNRRREKLDRILILFAKQTMITNDEVEKLLHVSDSTATRYLATLEKEGKIKQNTKKGQATSYSKI